jgi:glycosidase
MKTSDSIPVFEFHISRSARDQYRFEDSLFSFNGNVIFANFHAARLFAQKMNEQRDLARFPEKAVRAGQINAMGLIDEILHVIVQLYREQINPDVMSEAMRWLTKKIGRYEVDQALERFTEQFPPTDVYKEHIPIKEYLQGQTGGVSNRLIALEELLLLWLANVNPAFSPYSELFDHAPLEKDTAYSKIISLLHDFFDARPRFGPYNQNLVDMLRSPAVVMPYSLPGQLEYIRIHWGFLLGRYLLRLLGSLDLIQEEEKAAIFGGGGPGPSRVVDFTQLGHEPERYSPDLEWMPRLVLMAKNTYVWLDQLSKRYGRSIIRLDQIPDEELDVLAGRGFSGLWLIGLWERSQASLKIKRLCGNPEAVASAYSLFDYRIADDLGGEASFQNLKDRAWLRGIRMASDMVPNHMSIDSKWMIEHPDWFLSLDFSPFPAYRYDGPDLSEDGRVGIFVEDQYYSRGDAAVVFKRVDRWTGGVRYVYHGNDGTSMPWNDTAQLNYLRPDVREAVIRTILHVARLFPIIRFDAAMTLAKKHYQRLWFPEPGTGGAVPSRSDFGMTRGQFEAAMPEEFWRQVVDRVAREVPDTLLLAEAFWLMEGYFVRSLGMHRVYNSAFMNMLRDEDNAKYRTVVKNTLEFDPEILKRFVNFMNNPDERTAVEQFGKGDKYFGVCMMMVTMPGLPMFGHGQIEGFTEKYGMEYRRAYWDENPDEALVARHEREIFPLLHRRALFAGVDQFFLYDFFTPEGHVCEDVFAYSNRLKNDRALILYHNRYAHARGWIKTSAAHSVKTAKGGRRRLVRRRLAEGLGLSDRENRFCVFRDQTSGLEYIRSNRELWEQGLYVELNAYQAHVFLDWREVEHGEETPYGDLAAMLEGKGVPNIDQEMRTVFLRPIHQAFEALVNADIVKRVLSVRPARGGRISDETLVLEIQERLVRLLRQIKRKTHGSVDEEGVSKEIMKRLEKILLLKANRNRLPVSGSPKTALAVKRIKAHLDSDPRRNGVLFSWSCVHLIGKMLDDRRWREQTRAWIDEWRLGETVAGVLKHLGETDEDAWKSVTEVKFLTLHQHWFENEGRPQTAARVLEVLLRDDAVRQFLQFNRFQDVLWFNKEAFEELLAWLLCIAAVEITASFPESEAADKIDEAFELIQQLDRAKKKSGYQVEKLTEFAGKRH